MNYFIEALDRAEKELRKKNEEVWRLKSILQEIYVEGMQDGLSHDLRMKVCAAVEDTKQP